MGLNIKNQDEYHRIYRVNGRWVDDRSTRLGDQKQVLDEEGAIKPLAKSLSK